MNDINTLQKGSRVDEDIIHAVKQLAETVIKNYNDINDAIIKNNNVMRKQLEEMRAEIEYMKDEIEYLKSNIKNLNADSELSNLFKGVL